MSEVILETLAEPFRDIFDGFYECLFFAPWATFGRRRCPEGSRNGGKLEAKGYPETLARQRENHGIYVQL